jgi:plasmid stabilization system protein ParE
MKITYAEGVFEELLNLSGFLSDESEEIAQSFLDACDASFQFLAANPHAGAQRDFESPELSNVRMWRIRNFEKYLIFYVPTGKAIKILHIIHSARDYNRIFEDE